MNPDFEIIEEVLQQHELILRMLEAQQDPDEDSDGLVVEMADLPSSESHSAIALSVDRCEMDFMDLSPSRPQSANRERPAPPPPWAVGFSRQFRKDTAALDRKLLGRLLEVLEELTDYELPFQVKGDTFKPLTGELDGCWRYRLGDNRLVVRPVRELAQLQALTFASRGSVYD